MFRNIFISQKYDRYLKNRSYLNEDLANNSFPFLRTKVLTKAFNNCYKLLALLSGERYKFQIYG